MTLLELLLAVTIMSLLMMALSAMATAVFDSNEYAAGYGSAAHHARVVVDRIGRKISRATASENFPGVLVLEDAELNWTFPDTLIVWHPEGMAADAAGKPRLNEIVIYCPDPAQPSQLLEVISPDAAGVAPDVDDLTGWRIAVDTILADPSSKKVLLTDLLRLAVVPEAGTTSPKYQRGCARFAVRLRPSQAEWDMYRSGDLEWEELSWPQGIYGDNTGMRQVWVRFELQLDPTLDEAVSGSNLEPVPFFGSGSLYYELDRVP